MNVLFVFGNTLFFTMFWHFIVIAVMIISCRPSHQTEVTENRKAFIGSVIVLSTEALKDK